jgi:integrase
MGEVRRRTTKYCTTCQRTATPACVEAGHAIEIRFGAIWWVRYYRHGIRHEESSKSSDQSVAERLLKIREAEAVMGGPVDARYGRIRFHEAAADLLTDYQVNGKRSFQQVKRRIERILTPWFGRVRLNEITTSDITTYTADRHKKGAANATINRELALLKRMFTLAKRAKKLGDVPHIPMLAEDNIRRGFFEREQFLAVRRHLPVALQAVATFAYYTGWRTKSEILPLEWRQVDRVAGIVRLEPGTTKNREGRTFTYAQVSDELRAVIDGLWDAHQALEREGVICPYVFQRRGRPIKSYRKAWVTACTAAGCPGRIPHDFRRTAVRNLVRGGVSETIAMRMTGHKTRSVFDRYDIVSEEDLADGARKLGAYVSALDATGTIQGQTTSKADAEAFRDRIAATATTRAKSATRKQLPRWASGGPPGDRTRDTVIKSHVLYH